MQYTSKQVQIFQNEAIIFSSLSSFSNLTPIVADKVEGWKATDDKCSFKVQGFNVSLVMTEREPYKLIKVAGDETSPIPFSFWIQLKSIDDNDTRMRVILDIELTSMLKVIVGSKLQDAVDSIAEQIAYTFNCRHDFTAQKPNTKWVN